MFGLLVGMLQFRHGGMRGYSLWGLSRSMRGRWMKMQRAPILLTKFYYLSFWLFLLCHVPFLFNHLFGSYFVESSWAECIVGLWGWPGAVCVVRIWRLFLKVIYFLNKLKAPLSDLSWKTEICRPEEIRGGAFSICPKFKIFADRAFNQKPNLWVLLGMFYFKSYYIYRTNKNHFLYFGINKVLDVIKILSLFTKSVPIV